MNQQVESREGWATVDNGSHRVYYNAVGSGADTLVVLHGGPGIGHSYLRRLSEIAGDGLRVVFYDQLGGGRSEAPSDFNGWTVARFVAELESIRRELDLGRVHLLGQSWGGCLALQYSLEHPENVVSLVLSNTASSIPFVYSEMHRLRRELGPDVFARMLKHESVGTLNDPEYQALVNELYIRHLRRATPWSRERSLREWEEVGHTIGLDEPGPAYYAMWGPHRVSLYGSGARVGRHRSTPRDLHPSSDRLRVLRRSYR